MKKWRLLKSRKLELDEDIKVSKIPLKRVCQMIKKGKITDMGPVAALGLYRTIFDKH